MSGSQDEIPPPPPPPSSSQTPPSQQTPHTVSAIKLPILKKGEYDIWAMKMEHYLAITDNLIWENNMVVEMAGDQDFDENEQVSKRRGISYNLMQMNHVLIKPRSSAIDCKERRIFARKCRTKGNQDSRRRDAWNSGNNDRRRSGKQEDSKALVTIDGEGVDWTSHSEEEEDYALMACNSSG
ncbi:hypothetical protein Tco_0534373 [Tanacetum coccineum]